jgi:hypothetical protein
MMRPDGNKLQEIKDLYAKKGDIELSKMLAKVREVEEDPERELMDDEIQGIRQRFQFEQTKHLMSILMLQPERMYKLGYGHSVDGHGGWRSGYTKSTVASRVAKRRKQKKIARKTRQLQRGK